MSYDVIRCHMMSYDVLLRVPGPICYVPKIDSFVICALDLQWISGPAATARITSAAMQLRHECNVYRGISLSGCAVLISGDGSMNYVYIYVYNIIIFSWRFNRLLISQLAKAK